MNILGIIAEYNPFHNGHLYQLQKSIDAAQADFSVVVMSGNFTQRGEIAILSKRTRAEMAVSCGVDLVVELPFAFACNNAEYFAKGAVKILDGLGCVTHLSFGSESGDLYGLQKTADFLADETLEFKNNLKINLDSGMSYPKARSESVKQCIGVDFSELMTDPNNILAIEYLKQLRLIDSDIIPITVKRYASDYHDQSLTGSVASASAIRKSLLEHTENNCNDTVLSKFHKIKDFVPPLCFDTFQHCSEATDISAITHNNQEYLYFKLLASRILTTSSKELGEVFSVSEGLENRLKEAIRTANSLSQLKSTLKSKRYTSTRIDRLLAHVLINLTTADFQAILDSQKYYARILGFSENGSKLLKHIKKSKNATIPCITNINKESDSLVDSQLLLSYDLIATDLYNLLTEKNIYECSDQRFTPFRGYTQT